MTQDQIVKLAQDHGFPAKRHKDGSVTIEVPWSRSYKDDYGQPEQETGFDYFNVSSIDEAFEVLGY